MEQTPAELSFGQHTLLGLPEELCGPLNLLVTHLHIIRPWNPYRPNQETDFLATIATLALLDHHTLPVLVAYSRNWPVVDADEPKDLFALQDVVKHAIQGCTDQDRADLVRISRALFTRITRTELTPIHHHLAMLSHHVRTVPGAVDLIIGLAPTIPSSAELADVLAAHRRLVHLHRPPTALADCPASAHAAA